MWESGRLDATGRRLFVFCGREEEVEGEEIVFFIFYFICRESPRTGVFLIQITAPDLWREFLSSVILSKLGER